MTNKCKIWGIVLTMKILNFLGWILEKLCCKFKLLKVTEENILSSFSKEETKELFQPVSADGDLWVEPFRLVVKAWREDETLPPFGRLVARTYIRRILLERLHVQRLLSISPSIAEVQIVKPIFIIGSVRSGTTFLQTLLYQDPHNTSPLLYEMEYPASRDLKISSSDLDLFYTMNPEFKKKHNMVADGPHECYNIMQRSFVSKNFIFMCDEMSAYSYWLKTRSKQDMVAIYRFYKQQLQLILSMREDRRPKTLILKEALHSMHLDALLEVFPDALFINTVRNPAQVVASICSTEESGLSRWYGSSLNIRAMGERHMNHIYDTAMRLVNFRKQYDERFKTTTEGAFVHVSMSSGKASDRFLDIEFSTMMKDPMATVAQIYQHFGLTLTPEGRSACEQYLSNNPKNKYGKHDYQLERYGVTEEEVNLKFKEFNEYFKVQIGNEK